MTSDNNHEAFGKAVLGLGKMPVRQNVSLLVYLSPHLFLILKFRTPETA